MERILVSVTDYYPAKVSLSRAFSLARRIRAKVYVLLVRSPNLEQVPEWRRDPSILISYRERLERLIELARQEGLDIEYLVVKGDYREEVIRFADHYNITLWVTEPAGVGERNLKEHMNSIEQIRHRVQCRVELVHPRGQTLARKG